MLRRALSKLGVTERRYLLENLVALRGIQSGAATAAAIIQEKDKAVLQAISDELGDLDDLL